MAFKCVFSQAMFATALVLSIIVPDAMVFSKELCTEEKISEILEDAQEGAESVKIDCDVQLESNKTITKRLIFHGQEASGVTVDLNGALLNGGEGTINHGRDMVEIRSEEVDIKNVEGEISTYARPQNITIKNGTIIGSIRVRGMAKNGQGDAEYETKEVYECQRQSNGIETCTWVTRKFEIPYSNQFKKSSRTAEHTATARMNAPTHIVLDNLIITGVGRNPVYFAPGVTHAQLINSEVKGQSAVGLYLDAESGWNTIKNSDIHVSTKNYIFEKWDRPLIAIDGSSHNKIVNNRFSNLSHGGIYVYRNCGEGGVIRHTTPSYNQIMNNVFYYNKYEGDNPAVYVGSRDRGDWFHDTLGFCENDAGYPFGSSVSDKDYARYNAVMQNQVYKRSISEMIKTQNPSVNSPNYLADNHTVTEATVDYARPAGCYVYADNGGFLAHDESLNEYSSTCEGCLTTCHNGDLRRVPFWLFAILPVP